MPYRSLNVLVVEDDDFQCDLIKSMLHALGLYSVSVANNGVEALALIRDKQNKAFDLIISDLKMPQMDGMSFLRHLAEEDINIKLIILSALDKKLLAAVDKVANSYKIKLLETLEKPLTLQALKSALLKGASTQPRTKLKSKAPTTSYTLAQIQEGIRLNQFTPFLQPKVDLKTGKLVGAEALARWEHPEDGIVMPSEFIPVLEHHKQIDELTFCMLKTAAIACKKLMDNDCPMNIAVNLSLVSLDDTAMAKKITEVIASTGINPQYITLELTESAAMTDAPHALENLARLYMNGFTLSIDDYGTGYSNLQQLTRIAFGELKIDHSFVQGVADNEDMLVVVASSIDMAHKLNIKIVAEGVESAEDWRLLRKMDCDIGQGFFIAEPMRPDDYYHFVKNYTIDPVDTTPISVQQQNEARQKENEEYKLLIVDADRFIRRVLTEILNSLGYTNVKAVSNVQSAIDAFENQSFDLILTDTAMSGITGLAFIKRIRTGKTLLAADTRIIALSAVTQSNILGAALALDVNGLIVKPLTSDIIDRKVKQAFSEPTHIHASIAYEAIDVDFVIATDDNQPKPHPAKIADKRPEAYYVSIYALTEGMVINKPVYAKDGSLLLDAGDVLTEEMIKRLTDEKDKLESEDFLIKQTHDSSDT